MKILVAGDISVQDRAAVALSTKKTIVWEGVKDLTSNHAHAFVNLESPVTQNKRVIYKDGRCLKNDKAVLSLLKDYGFDLVTLANNHLKDFGNIGVSDTLEELKKAGIGYVGAGANLYDSRCPLILEEDEEKIGIINVCENELAIATEDTPGAHPLDLIELFYSINELRNHVNKIIVIVHGGCEYYQLPTPAMKKRYHYIADLGVDAILNHHQHCFSGFEVYNSVPIFYGLGNFYFDNPRKRDCSWNYGLLVSLDTRNLLNFSVIPFEQCNESPSIRLLKVEVVEKRLEELNEIIADDKRLQDEFVKEISKKRPLSPFLPYENHYLRALYHRDLFPDFLSNMKKAEILNKVRCETHFEILTTVLNNSFKDKTK